MIEKPEIVSEKQAIEETGQADADAGSVPNSGPVAARTVYSLKLFSLSGSPFRNITR